MQKRYGGNLASVTARARLAQRREPYWLPIVRGAALGYRKGANGGSWILRLTSDDGRKHYNALGPADDLNDDIGLDYAGAFDQARKLAHVPAPASLKATVNDALNRYTAKMRAENAPASTLYDATCRIDSIIRPALGAHQLAKLTAEQIGDFLNRLAEGRSGETVKRIWALLKAALNHARREKIAPYDGPWRDVKLPKSRAVARKVHLSAVECRTLLSHCKPAQFRDLVRAALLTGARYGELVGLRVRDFEPSTATLDIAAGKTGGRVAYLSDEAVGFFAELAKGRAAADPLLPKASGETWGKNHHQKLMVRAVTAAKLDAETVFYSLRHTHISLALLAGVHIQVLAENCGTSVRMIEKHYGKFLRRDRSAMFDRLPALA